MNMCELAIAQAALPSWQILAWPSVRIAVPDWQASAQRLRHVSATVERDRRGRLQGQVLWAGETDGSMLGLAWDWKEAVSGVPTLLDPMSVLSNIELFDVDGRALTEGERLLHVNGSIYSLPWQDYVLETV